MPTASQFSGNQPSGRVQLLLVSDDRKLHRLLARFLGTFHYHVRQTTDRQVARHLLKTTDCDLLLVDAGAAPSVAIEFCSDTASIKQKRQPFHTILLADPQRTIASEDIIAADIDDVLAKPLRYGELLARLRTALRYVHFQRRMQAQADLDPTTQLPGRAAMLRRLHSLDADDSTIRVLAALEIDYLDSILASHGPKVAARVIQTIADHLHAWSVENQGELIVALGYGRFGMLCPAPSENVEDAEDTAAVTTAIETMLGQLRQSVADLALSLHVQLGNPSDAEGNAGNDSVDSSKPQQLNLTASIGWVPFTGTPESAEAMVDHAVKAMLGATHSGRDCAARHGQFDDEEQLWQTLAEPGKLFETTTARDVMVPCPIVLQTVDRTDYAMHIFRQTALEAVPVVDENGVLAGLIRRSQLLDEDDTPQVDQSEPVAVHQIMSAQATTCDLASTFGELMQAFAVEGTEQVIVVCDGKPTGMITPKSLSMIAKPVSHEAFRAGTLRQETEYLLV